MRLRGDRFGELVEGCGGFAGVYIPNTSSRLIEWTSVTWMILMYVGVWDEVHQEHVKSA